MNFRINQPVSTPIGEGIYQGVFQMPAIVSDDAVALVRVKVDDKSSPYLRASNCLTPHALLSGLWTFKESELQ